MVYRGKSEFAGGPGMVQPEQEGNLTPEQEMWEIKATNPGLTPGSVEPDALPTADKVGKVQTWAIPAED